MYRKFALYIFAVLVCTGVLYPIPLVKVEYYREAEVTVTAPVPPFNRITIKCRLKGKPLGSGQGAPEGSYYAVSYDELLVVRKIEKFAGHHLEWQLLMDKKGRVELYYVYDMRGIQLEVGLSSGRQLLGVKRRIGSDIYYEKNNYHARSGVVEQKQVYKNGELQQYVDYSYLEGQLIEVKTYEPGGGLTGLQKIEIIESAPAGLRMKNQEKYTKKIFYNYTGEHELSSIEEKYYNQQEQLVFVLVDSKGIKEFNYNSRGQLSREILVNRWSGKKQRQSDFYYLNKEGEYAGAGLLTGGEARGLLVRRDYEPGREKLRSYIFLYDRGGNVTEGLQSLWRARGWRFDKNYVSEHHYTLAFNASSFLKTKYVYDLNNEQVGYYDYSYDAHNNLVEERFYGPEDEMIKRISYFYTSMREKKKAPPITAYLQGYGATGFYFTGVSLFKALELEAWQSQGKKIPENFRKHKKHLLQMIRYVLDHGLNKVIYYDHTGRTVQYLRISRGGHKGGKVVSFNFYGRPVDFFYREKKGWAYYKKHPGGKYIYKKPRAPLYRDRVGRKREFEALAYDNVNPGRLPDKEGLWKTYRFYVDNSCSTIIQAKRVYYDAQWQTTESALIKGKDIKIIKSPDHIDVMFDRYVDKLSR